MTGVDDDGLVDEPAPPMTCGFCGKLCPWNPFGRCSWEHYDQDRDDPTEHAAMVEAAPEAFAFFLGLGPGEKVEG